MNRKQLEIALAYAERDREMLVGRMGEDGKITPKLVVTERPAWLADGNMVKDTADGERRIVVIGGDKVCLLQTVDGDEIITVDTDRLSRHWEPAEAQAAA